MNKTELIEHIAESGDFSKAAAGRALEAMIEAVTNEVSSGGKVTIIGFGTFMAATRGARTGRNPKTGKEIKIAASVVPKFKAGAAFRGVVAKKAGKAKKK
ncbi:MAG: DNA-binding protein [Hydrogenophilales bacterium 17-61-9]|nr:MAG: DNA-binding protein [Hydrogenophilales bacterium 17-61-9]